MHVLWPTKQHIEQENVSHYIYNASWECRTLPEMEANIVNGITASTHLEQNNKRRSHNLLNEEASMIQTFSIMAKCHGTWT